MSSANGNKIGPVLATFVVANNMIGSGFFLLPATLAQSGSVTMLSWILGTFLAAVLGGTFARLARDYPNLQCADDYARPALGRDAGFLATTLYWVSSWIGNNAIAVAAFGYLATLLPVAADLPATQMYGQLALIWLMFALNLLGPKQVARFQSLCVILGLAPVAVVLIGGWGQFNADIFGAAWNVTDRSDGAVVFGSLSTIFWAFVGLETGAMIAGVVRDPDRNVPRATIAGITIAGVIYILSSVLVMGIVPAGELAQANAPFAVVAGRLFGDWGMLAIAAAAALKATGTLGGWMLVSGESGARAAQRGFLPAIFGRTLGNGAAVWGLFFIALAMTVIAFGTSSATLGEQFGVIINMAVLLMVFAYATAGLAVMIGTPQRPATARDRLLGIGAVVACVLLVVSSGLSTVLGTAGIALVAWLLYRLFRRRPPDAVPVRSS